MAWPLQATVLPYERHESPIARSRQPAVPQFAIGHPEYVIQQPGGWTNETALDYAYDEVRDQ